MSWVRAPVWPSTLIFYSRVHYLHSFYLERPKLMYDDSLTEHNLRSGQPFSFDIDFSAHPLPTVDWFLNDQPLTSSQTCDVTTTDWRTSVTFKPTQKEHEGRYKVTVKNVTGEKSVTFDVKVKGNEIKAKSVGFEFRKFVNKNILHFIFRQTQCSNSFGSIGCLKQKRDVALATIY